MPTSEDDCPICNASSSAKEQFATAKVTEHIKTKARHDETHQAWLDEHTENGMLAEIRMALEQDADRPQQA